MDKKVTIAFSTAKDFKDRLDEIASQRGVSVSAIVNIALFDYFQYVNAKEQLAKKRAEAEEL